MNDQTTTNMDGGWKQIIENYLEEFCRFFFPEIHASLNFNADYRFLDKELAKLMVDTETGDRRADKLIQVQWIEGTIEWILLHVEVQTQRDADFAQRMYIYHYRIWDRYRKPVISLALLVDETPGFRPDRFHREKGGCELDRVMRDAGNGPLDPTQLNLHLCRFLEKLIQPGLQRSLSRGHGIFLIFRRNRCFCVVHDHAPLRRIHCPNRHDASILP
ncbi:MAG: hypothetical protein ACQESR_23130 [Planctomycetota bacterium]